jgi:glycerophosphoryl diester phosphodiesterase
LWRDADVPPLLSSFDEASLVAARDAVPQLPRALLLDELPVDWLDRLRALECVALDANHKVLDVEIVKAAHRGGFRVCCYTPNDMARVTELAGWGVDTIITDAVDQIAADAFPNAAA